MFRGIAHRFNLLRYSMRAVGTGRMVRNSVRWAGDRDARCVDSGFDERHGTDTNTELTPGEARIPRGRRRGATMYLPTMDEDLSSLLEALPWSHSLRARSTFVDLGSGKGRAVFLAAMRGFREVVGVELSPLLHQVANDNLAILENAYVLPSPVRFVQADAANYAVPDGPVLTYLYHPFDESTANQVIDRLAHSVGQSPRPAAVLYCQPTIQRPLRAQVFTRHDVLRCVAEGARETRRFQIGWSVWTNDAWLQEQRRRGHE